MKEKCSITSLVHQWILCSEWVPSDWESKQLIKTSEKLHVCKKQILNYYCDVFISCLFSYSDGTHSLHWWGGDIMIHFSKSVPMKKQTHLHLGWPKGEKMFILGWTVPFIKLTELEIIFCKNKICMRPQGSSFCGGPLLSHLQDIIFE